MVLPLCPFHVECQFFAQPAKTGADDILSRWFCYGRYDACRIAIMQSQGVSIPAGMCPDGEICG